MIGTYGYGQLKSYGYGYGHQLSADNSERYNKSWNKDYDLAAAVAAMASPPPPLPDLRLELVSPSDDRYEDLVTVREQTLWPGQRHMCYLEADRDGIHFAAVLNSGRVIGVVSAYQKNARHFVIRKFGVLEEFRGKGVGKWLLNAAEQYLAERGAGAAGGTEIELDAREGKVGLYEHTGYELVGERFQKYGGGTWYVKMAKLVRVAEEE